MKARDVAVLSSLCFGSALFASSHGRPIFSPEHAGAMRPYKLAAQRPALFVQENPVEDNGAIASSGDNNPQCGFKQSTGNTPCPAHNTKKSKRLASLDE